MEDLQRRFDLKKKYMTEDLGRIPTDKEVWEAMRKVTHQNMLEAEMDDCQGIVLAYQKRIALIDVELRYCSI